MGGGTRQQTLKWLPDKLQLKATPGGARRHERFSPKFCTLPFDPKLDLITELCFFFGNFLFGLGRVYDVILRCLKEITITKNNVYRGFQFFGKLVLGMM